MTTRTAAGTTSDTGTTFRFWPVPGQPTLPLDRAGNPDRPTRRQRTTAGQPATGGWGTWRLAAGEREWDITLTAIPAPGPCSHEHATASYQPGTILRALVQVRDGQCAMPVCGHPARGTQFEHAIPWPAGPSCNCNGGLHCTRHHRVKDQAPGWSIQQLPDGRRRWTTPRGLTYTSQHRQYPD
jgi:hypothetical protein